MMIMIRWNDFFSPTTEFGANEGSGVVISPSYSVTSPQKIDCIYLISHHNRSYINFSFVNMDIECEESTSSEGSYLEIRDGYSSDSPLIGRFCGIRSIPVLKQTSLIYIRAR